MQGASFAAQRCSSLRAPAMAAQRPALMMHHTFGLATSAAQGSAGPNRNLGSRWREMLGSASTLGQRVSRWAARNPFAFPWFRAPGVLGSTRPKPGRVLFTFRLQADSRFLFLLRSGPLPLLASPRWPARTLLPQLRRLSRPALRSASHLHPSHLAQHHQASRSKAHQPQGRLRGERDICWRDACMGCALSYVHAWSCFHMCGQARA